MRSERGPWPINGLWPHATIAGTSLHCSGCGAGETAPRASMALFNGTVEGFLGAHRLCVGASS